MKTFHTPEDLQHAPAEIRDRLALIVGDEAIEDVLGGPVCIVEYAADLKQVVTSTPSALHPGAWASVLECPGAFDSAEWVGDYLEVLACSNDAGGTLYFIPRPLVTQNLERSIEMTNAANQPK
jgi:hypothetical protein